MPFLPISPLSPELTLIKPIGAAASPLGPIPNVSDGIPGIGGIGSVEMPGIGVLNPGAGGFSFPSAPILTEPAPNISPSPSATSASGSGAFRAPEVTPFPGVMPSPTTTPTPGPLGQAAPTPQVTAQPKPDSTPVPGAGQIQPTVQGSPYSTQPITTTRIPDPIQTPFTPSVTTGIPIKQSPAAETFGKYLKDAVSNYNDVQTQADSMVQHLAVGDKVDIHDVALAVQKASITNQLAIQVRNRLVESYQEVMRMSM
jgi:flagellar hook-basal body complex protein FliE